MFVPSSIYLGNQKLNIKLYSCFKENSRALRRYKMKCYNWDCREMLLRRYSAGHQWICFTENTLLWGPLLHWLWDWSWLALLRKLPKRMLKIYQFWNVEKISIGLFCLICLFVWLHWILVATCRIFDLSCSAQNLVPQPDIEPGPPALGVQRLATGPAWKSLDWPFFATCG